MIPALLTITAVFSIACSSAVARQTEPQSLDEKISRSDDIFVGRVVYVEKPDDGVVGVYAYALIVIEDVIKGYKPQQTISFITKGAYSELNPRCCSVGSRYILFTQRGFDILDGAGGKLVAVREGITDYHSSVNGPYSAYEIIGKKVVGWPNQMHSNAPVSTRKVLREIRAATRRVTHRQTAR